MMLRAAETDLQDRHRPAAAGQRGQRVRAGARCSWWPTAWAARRPARSPPGSRSRRSSVACPTTAAPRSGWPPRVREANHQIYERSRADRGRAGMGTTLTAAYVDDAHVAIAHVGDSRAYLFRDGTLQRLTQDHSLVDELVRRGKLTEEQAAEHPQRSIITRALGPEPDVEVDTWTYPARRRRRDPALQRRAHLDDLRGAGQGGPRVARQPRRGRRRADQRGQRGGRPGQHHRGPVPARGGWARTQLGRGDDGRRGGARVRTGRPMATRRRRSAAARCATRRTEARGRRAVAVGPATHPTANSRGHRAAPPPATRRLEPLPPRRSNAPSGASASRSRRSWPR